MKKNIVNEAIKDANTLLGDDIAGLEFLTELRKKKKKGLVLLCEKYLIAIYGMSEYYKAKQDIDKIGDARWADLEQALVAFGEMVLAFPQISRQLILSTMNQRGAYETNQIHSRVQIRGCQTNP